MQRLFVLLVLAGLIPAAGGCRGEGHFSGALLSTKVSDDMEVVGASLMPPNQRYIAERHKLEILSSESGLQHAWESAVAFCGTIQCEVTSSSITARTANSAPSGDLSLRVSPGDLNKLLARLDKLGVVLEHMTQREDKTADVVDTDAKIKNLTSFRDSLRAMLARPSATVKDLVAIQQQLADTQSELDSETAQRKILANETEKIAVQVSFLLESYVAKVSGLHEIWNALRESGEVLADSTASVITTVVFLVPWLILIVPGLWLLAKAWKAMRRRHIRNGESQPSVQPGTI
jgi:hypothetical protein